MNVQLKGESKKCVLLCVMIVTALRGTEGMRENGYLGQLALVRILDLPINKK